MNIDAPKQVELTDEEQVLLESICFDPREMSHDVLRESCRNAKPLAGSLLKRKAVPRIRLEYFTDPEYNIGSQRSRKQIFEDNGTVGEAILGHGNFLNYLRYFIFGPDLPEETIRKFCQIVSDDHFQSHELLGNLRSFARRETRENNLDRKTAAEEFYKLCLECQLEGYFTRSVRDAVMQIRTRK